MIKKPPHIALRLVSGQHHNRTYSRDWSQGRALFNIYESEKRRIQHLNLSSVEYQEAIKALAERLGI